MNTVPARDNSRLTMVMLGMALLLLFSLMGYVSVASGQGGPDDQEPFITNRVVEVRIVMSDEDWRTCQVDALEERYVPADFWFDGELIPDVAVRPKGNSSLNSVYRSGSNRLSFKIDFNFFNSARTFRGLKKLNLNNGFNDPTLIRECLAYEVFDLMGLPTPRTAFVDLWVNDTHMGLYTQVEQVDVTFLRGHFADAGGNLYKPEPPAGYLAWTGEELEKQQTLPGINETEGSDMTQEINMGGAKLADIMMALEGEDYGETYSGDVRANPPAEGRTDFLERMGLKTNESYPDHSALIHFLEVLNDEPDETFVEEIEKVLDVDSVLRFIAVAGTVGYFDSYLGIGHNYYLYEMDGKFTIIPWDLNGAFGSFSMNLDRDGILNCYIDEPTIGPLEERPLVARLLAHEPYRDAYHGYLEELLAGPFSVERMTERIDAVADQVRPYVYADELKFYSSLVFERALAEDVPRQDPMAGGPDNMPVPAEMEEISPQAMECLKLKFERKTLEELRVRRPGLEELEDLKSCLTPPEMKAFLRPAPGKPGQMETGTYIGLKTFVMERTESIRGQLDGDLPAAGDGSGNGESMTGRPAGLPPA